MSELRRYLVTAAFASTIFLAATSGTAPASHVHCGDAIFTDTTLDSDLIDCPGVGLEVSADNVTVDLNGHVIEADDVPNYVNDAGVRNFGSDNVTIENGTIKGFTVSGVELAQTAGTVVRGLQIEIDDAGASGVRLLTDCADNTISDNTISAGPFVSRGIWASDCFPRVTPNRIERNTTIDVGAPIYVGAGHDLIVRDNVLLGGIDNGIELFFAADRNLIEGNLVIAPSPSDSFHAGIALQGGSENVVSQNEVIGRAYGIAARAGGNRIQDNLVREATVDGIAIEAPDNLVVRNRAGRAGDDGIDVDSPSTTVIGNHTWFNGDFGIEALPDTVGGRNWAKHNGNRAQCTPARLCSTRGKPKR
jgi:Periplasmic copper-binding protein (NosD)